MLELFAELYLRVVESFGVVFSLAGQVFKYRPWMLPLIPVAAMVIYFGVKMRRQGEQREAERRRTAPRPYIR
ncbi:MAG: hypothetical protein ACT4N4_16555 [Rhodospirillales bacterium]